MSLIEAVSSNWSINWICTSQFPQMWLLCVTLTSPLWTLFWADCGLKNRTSFFVCGVNTLLVFYCQFCIHYFIFCLYFYLITWELENPSLKWAPSSWQTIRWESWREGVSILGALCPEAELFSLDSLLSPLHHDSVRGNPRTLMFVFSWIEIKSSTPYLVCSVFCLRFEVSNQNVVAYTSVNSILK